MMTKLMKSISVVLWMPIIGAVAAFGQLSAVDIATLQNRGRSEGWTFTVSKNPATKYAFSQLCGLVEPSNWRATARFAAVVTPQQQIALPAAFDWRTQTGLPPIRDQGGCGSCWAFATVGALECAIRIRDGVDQDLSEQWLVSCNLSGWSCSGGWYAHDYHQSSTDSCGGSGAVMEVSFPYQAADVACNCPYPHAYWLQNWAYLPADGSGIPSVDDIKQAIMTYGPVSVSVGVDSAFQGYSSGIFNACSAGTINHSVVLVGWDDNGGNGYWILRNSWGSWWGESGYMRIAYNCSSVGYAACWINYAGTDDLRVNPSGGVISSGPVGGPFSPDSQMYALINVGTNGLTWSAIKSASWLDLSSTGGSLTTGASNTITVSFNTIAPTLPAGVYTDAVIFSNAISGASQTRTVTLRVGQPDYYTELFDTVPNDLVNQALTFTPDGSTNFYAVCRVLAANFPTDPTGGTFLSLDDDSYAQIALLDGKSVSLYGTSYTTFFVGSNGYITFDSGDTDFTESITDHFAKPRIAALFDDLYPGSSTVSWKQLDDRVAVTYQNVPEYSTINSNSFQIEMFFDGTIRITYLALAATDGLAGLSRGLGVPPDFVQSDLSDSSLCFMARSNSWINSSRGYWDDPQNWSLGVRPTNSHSILITNALSKTVTIDSYTTATYPESMSVSNLAIWGETGSINTLLSINSGTSTPLRVLNDLNLGNPGFANTSGELVVSNSAVEVLGDTFSVGGTVTIQSGGVIIGPALGIGSHYAGSPGAVWVVGGTLIVTNGTTTIGGPGNGATDGQLILSNGIVKAGDLYLADGISGNPTTLGILTIAGGSMSLSGGIDVGWGAASGGEIFITGGELVATNGTITLGVYRGEGSMQVTDGKVLVNSIRIADGFAAGGLLTLSGGSVVVLGDFVTSGGGNAAIANALINGGTLQVLNGSMLLGYGSFHNNVFMTIAGGHVQVRDVGIGGDANADEQLSVESGTLTVYSSLTLGIYPVFWPQCESLGGIGTKWAVVQSGGAVFVTNVSQNAFVDVRNGTFTFSSGTLVIDKLVLTNACGHFVHTGGELSIMITNIDPNLSAVGDGIPNGWKTQHGFDPFDPNVANTDSDGDGFSNLQEYLAGTDPTNGTSAFRVLSLVRESDNIRVTWLTVGGHTNIVQAISNLGSGFFDVSPNIIITGSGDAITNYLDLSAVTNSPGRFYRIRLVP